MDDRKTADEASETSEAGEETPEREAGEEDLRSRFPDPETDERLKVPQGPDLPEVPRADIRRPEPRVAEGGGITDRIGNTMDDLRKMGAASTIGITLALSIAIGTGLGWLADEYLLHSKETPWGLIVGFLMGTASGFINLVRVANQMNRDE